MQNSNSSSLYLDPQKTVDLAEEEFETQNNAQFKKSKSMFKQLMLVATASCLFSIFTYKNLSISIEGMPSFQSKNITLELKEGEFTKTKEKIHHLGPETKSLETHSDNLFQILVKPWQKTPLSITLKALGSEEVLQTFSMMSHYENSRIASGYVLEFTISESAELYIPEIQSEALAKINILQDPIPQVKLELMTIMQQPWPDNLPVPLKISVQSQNNLHQVHLKFSVDGNIHEELVDTITTPTTESEHTYDLQLETYLQSDFAKVEIVATASDHSKPKPLTGRSRPIQLKIASAYGRYLNTLEKLHKVKSSVDQWVSEGQKNTDFHQMQSDMKDVLSMSHNSPFFDSLDRLNLDQIKNDINNTADSRSPSEALEASHKIDSFLQEHEMLNDRERDRDFFVALRGLSRLVENTQTGSQHLKSATSSLKSFLKDRHSRWKQRVQKLSTPPASWKDIQANPFEKRMNSFQKSLAQNQKNDALSGLSKMSHNYRKWINQLEEIEDQERESQEQKRQKGLASAQKVLRELQQRQTKVSTQLDQASLNKQEIDNQWPLIRMEQNTNVKKTEALTAQLQRLAPQAAQRLNAAKDAMAQTVKFGQDKEFPVAETFADRAGRLLREANRKASQAQQRSQRRGRRRRISGDKYYGRSVSGGVDLHREYTVDRRYREDILDEVSRSNQNQTPEDSNLLNSYLRRIIR